MKPVTAWIKPLFTACLLAAQPVSASSDYLSRPDVRSFIDSMSEEHGIETSDLERILGNVRYQPAVVRLMGPAPSSAPSPARSYSRYREKFLTPALISAGSRFWSLHAEELARAEAEFGVPAEVILGVLGVETNFGAIRARSVQSTRWRRSPSTACAARNTSVMN